MRLAVVQHRLRESSQADAHALADAARAAAERGAELVVFPEVLSFDEQDTDDRALLYSLLDQIPDGQRLIPGVAPGVSRLAFVAEAMPGFEELGKVALMIGDSCFVGSEWVKVLGSSPDMIVMCPRSESDLQAEACVELALGLSVSAAGLVIVVEPDGAQPGEPGHGGSVIVSLGEVIAEAIGPEDLLVADVALPLDRPEPREPFPEIPRILRERVAHHSGTKLAVDYPADLSDGPGQP